MRDADQAGGVDEDRAQHVAEHLHAHDGERAGARRSRRIDVVAASRTCVVTLSATRAIGGTNTQVSDTIALMMPAPSAPESAMASSTDGKA